MNLVSRRIHTLLPIALALILPGLSLYANATEIQIAPPRLVVGWFLASALLYGWWKLIWELWEFKSYPRKARLILLISVFIIFTAGFFYRLNVEATGQFNRYYFFRIALATIMFLAIQYAMRAQENIARLRLEKEQIQTEHYRTQLKAIRAQIDPHFLFNSLNTLRYLVRQGHAHAEPFVMSLSDFYRQTLNHQQSSCLPLSEELEVLSSYLFLMKSRNEEAVQVDIQVDPDLQASLIPTLALQTVVENCFKHNSMTAKKPLRISVRDEQGYIVVKNNRQPKLRKPASSGFGLETLRKRYALMNIADGVQVEENEAFFSTKLKLIREQLLVQIPPTSMAQLREL
ncbi:MAG: histidine kinase [Bacteroidota bacterium]